MKVYGVREIPLAEQSEFLQGGIRLRQNQNAMLIFGSKDPHKARAFTRWIRGSPPEGNGRPLVSGALLVNQLGHQVFVNEQIVELTPIQYRLLVFLMRNPGRTFSHDSLFQGSNGKPLASTDSVRAHIYNLRRKLKLPFPYIKTVHGFGYCFVGPQQLERAAS